MNKIYSNNSCPSNNCPHPVPLTSVDSQTPIPLPPTLTDIVTADCNDPFANMINLEDDAELECCLGRLIKDSISDSEDIDIVSSLNQIENTF